jgi:hypothetical protein
MQMECAFQQIVFLTAGPLIFVCFGAILQGRWSAAAVELAILCSSDGDVRERSPSLWNYFSFIYTPVARIAVQLKHRQRCLQTQDIEP